MGNRTARNTGIPGTSVEAIGDKGKMSYLNESPLVKLDRIQREAEARGYRRGVEDAWKVARTHGVHPHLNVFGGGPEWYKHGQAIAEAILALLEQTSDMNSPHPKSGAGASAEAK
jgi:hypothetical protein